MDRISVHCKTTLLWSAVLFLQGLCGVNAAICVGPVCRFTLNVSLYTTMTYNGAPVFLEGNPVNGTRLYTGGGSNIPTQTVSPNDVIIADGFRRDVILFNGQLPGPTIEVMEGVQIVVKINNMLTQKVITVHWHGILQNNTYFMDGAESVTQCPILPGNSFTYRFWALPSGTHWYHAHLASIRLDGLFGMLLVHKARPTIPYFPVFVNDWVHDLSEHFELLFIDRCELGGGAISPRLIAPPFDCSFEGAQVDPRLYVSSLFDGRNRWQNQSFPLKEYVVKSGQRYRFRMVNSGVGWPFIIRIDKHPLTIVESDGGKIQPIVVESFFIYTGESIDFEIVANQAPGRYWIRADTQCSGSFARGILVYEGFQNVTRDPISQPVKCTGMSPCSVFNCPFGRYPNGSNRTCISMADANSTLSKQEVTKTYGNVSDNNGVTEVFMNFAMNAGPSINGRRYMMPSVPLFHNKSTLSNCVGTPCLDGCSCQCTGIIPVPYGKTIRLIVSNLQPNPLVVQTMYHNVHVHGLPYVVLAEKFPTYNKTTGRMISPNRDITCGNDALCANPRWSGSRPKFKVVTPVVKDTLVIPVRGYVVIQFIANNPGYWFVHCHIDPHMMSGMAVVLKVGPTGNEFPALPAKFPECEPFD